MDLLTTWKESLPWLLTLVTPSLLDVQLKVMYGETEVNNKMVNIIKLSNKLHFQIIIENTFVRGMSKRKLL